MLFHRNFKTISGLFCTGLRIRIGFASCRSNPALFICCGSFCCCSRIQVIIAGSTQQNGCFQFSIFYDESGRNHTEHASGCFCRSLILTICRFCCFRCFCFFLLGCIGCLIFGCFFYFRFRLFCRRTGILFYSIFGFFFCRCFFFSILGSLICCFRLFFCGIGSLFTVFCSVLCSIFRSILICGWCLGLVRSCRCLILCRRGRCFRRLFCRSLCSAFTALGFCRCCFRFCRLCCFFALRRFLCGCAAFCLCCFFLRIC